MEAESPLVPQNLLGPELEAQRLAFLHAVQASQTELPPATEQAPQIGSGAMRRRFQSKLAPCCSLPRKTRRLFKFIRLDILSSPKLSCEAARTEVSTIVVWEQQRGTGDCEDRRLPTTRGEQVARVPSEVAFDTVRLERSLQREA